MSPGPGYAAPEAQMPRSVVQERQARRRGSETPGFAAIGVRPDLHPREAGGALSEIGRASSIRQPRRPHEDNVNIHRILATRQEERQFS